MKKVSKLSMSADTSYTFRKCLIIDDFRRWVQRERALLITGDFLGGFFIPFRTEDAFIKVGKQLVWIGISSACLISASVTPASLAFMICLSSARGWRLAAETAIFINRRIFSGSGPDFSWISLPRDSWLECTSGNYSLKIVKIL